MAQQREKEESGQEKGWVRLNLPVKVGGGQGKAAQ
jgi:hypothetical protein